MGEQMGVWGLAWVLFAAAAGSGLAAAVSAFAKRSGDADQGEYGAGYNALAPIIDQR